MADLIKETQLVFRHYEVIFLVHPDNSSKVKGMIEKYQALITESGGKVSRVEDWGRRQLAYPIKKVHKAHYVLMNMTASKEVMSKLQELLKYNDNVLRELILQVSAVVTQPSPIVNPDDSYEQSLED
jgi:small subunit ribosomal protein S6